MYSSFPSLVVSREQAQLSRIAAYLQEHFAETANLSGLAQMAGFSKYHFHRLFTARYGQTPGDYLKRIRLEQAACRLLSGHHTRITDIAYECGFSSSQHFANSFKKHYGVPPGMVRNGFDWRTIVLKKNRIMENVDEKRHCLPVEFKPKGAFIRIPVVSKDGRNAESEELEVMDFHSYRTASIRMKTIPFSESMANAAQKIIQWSISRKLYLVGGGQFMIAVKIVPDADGEFTFDVCVTIPEDMTSDEEENIKIRHLPGGRYGVYHGKFRTIDDFASAREKIINGWWLSGYFPRDPRPLYVIIYNALSQDASRNWLVDICLPVTTLSK